MPEPFITFLLAAGAVRLVTHIADELKRDTRPAKSIVTPKPAPMPKALPIISLVGATSTGKSSTINGLLGQYLSEVSPAHSTTNYAQKYDFRDGWQLQDTPGLLDGSKNYSAVVLKAIQRSRLVIYVSEGQLYQQDMESVRRIKREQISWDNRSSTPNERNLALFINKADVQQQTMTSQDRLAQHEATINQVKDLIPAEYIVYGSASPIEAGERQIAELSALIALLDSIIGQSH